MFPVVWHRKAVRERKNILRYWILHNGSASYSRKLNAEIRHIQKLLSENPEMGTISELEGIRFVVILRNFSLYYQFKITRSRFYLFGITAGILRTWIFIKK